MVDELTEITIPTFESVLEARAGFGDHIVKTPVFTNSEIDELVGRQVFFKAENLQTTGSFKSRGAFNAVTKAKQSGFDRIVTSSSGNHGIGVAWACRYHDIPCTVYVPPDTCQAKKDAIVKYGAEIVLVDRETIKDGHKRKKFYVDYLKYGLPDGLTYISPCEGEDVVSGQGTVGVEFLEQVPDLDAILVSVGGGGLCAGTSLAAKTINPKIKVYAVEPLGKDLERSLQKGRRLWAHPSPRIDTVAEGVRKMVVAKVPFKTMNQFTEKDVISVADHEIIKAMKLIYSKMKLVIEVSAGLGVAGVLSDKMKTFDPSIKKVGVILCGGNADLDNLPWIK